MSAPADERDDPFPDLLAAHEEALRGGVPPVAPPPAELQGRIDDALRCVEMLQRLWPAPVSPPENDHERGRRYQLLRLHATGGVGQVWLAQDVDLEREVALKEPRAGRGEDAVFRQRFLQEARVTGRLQHPGVVPVYEMVPGSDGEPPFYTMRFVSGRTLGEAIRDYHAAGTYGVLELNALLGAFVSVCQTVAYAHAQGIIHRDLKSANVVVGDFGEVVLLDWGFAKELGQAEDVPATPIPADASPELTVAGEVVGTPAYMAPEQAAGLNDRVGPLTDVFGLGAILYEILTGRPPFSGAQTHELIQQARIAQPQPPQQVRRGVPPALAAICSKAMAREPEDRYLSAGELAREVQRFLADEPPTAYREPRLERLRRWGRRHKPLVAGAMALLITGFTALMIGLVMLEREQARTAEVQAQAAAEKAKADAAARAALERRLYVERLGLAERELAAHNLGRATQLLAACPEEQRGWEWACLDRLCRVDLVTLRGHPAPVSGAVFCLGGKRIVSASHDHTLKMWDAASGAELQTLAGHANVVHCLAVSPNGRRIASGSWDRTVKIWDAANGQLLKTLDGHPTQVIRVAFADDHSVASASEDTVRLWDIESGQEIRRFSTPGVAIYGLAISPDASLIAIGGSNDLIALRQLQTGKEVRVLTGHRSPPKHLAFSPDSRLLAAGDGKTLESEPGSVKVWDVGSGREVASLEGHTYPVFSVAFSPDGRRLVSGSQDSSIKVWDVGRRELVLTLRGHADTIRSLAFSNDGLRLASASADHTVRIWDATPWANEPGPGELRVLRGHADPVLGVAASADGTVFSVTPEAAFRTWDTDAAHPPRRGSLTDRNHPFYSFAASKKRDRLALGTGSGAIILADPNSGRELSLLPGFGGGPVKGLAFDNAGRLLAAAEWRGTVCLWNLEKGSSVTLRGHAEPVVGVAFSPDDKYVASASHDQTVKIWDVAAAREVRTLQGHTSRVLSVAFSPTGEVLASGANDGSVKVWDAKTGGEMRELRGHTAAVGAMAFSPDDHLLATASDDWTVKLWDMRTGALLMTYRGHEGPVRALTFEPGGRRLVSGSQDQTVRLWEVP